MECGRPLGGFQARICWQVGNPQTMSLGLLGNLGSGEGPRLGELTIGGVRESGSDRRSRTASSLEPSPILGAPQRNSDAPLSRNMEGYGGPNNTEGYLAPCK
jgi:hypothetical protein